MQRSHTHYNAPGATQNQGNTIGDRPCVRQSKIGREHEGGNQMKELMGHGELKWDTNKTEGAYTGGRVYDAQSHALVDLPSNPQSASNTKAPEVRARGRGYASQQQSVNIFGH
eukprot:PhF_6_TR17303/c0_g1_i1/m.26525